MSNPDPSADVREARETVIEAFERTAELYDLKRSYGRLYGVLFFADEPVSLDELVEESGYAKSTVSTAMTAMERLHVVHRRSVPGRGRKAFYEAERELWDVLQQFLRREVRREIDLVSRALSEAEAELETLEDDRADADLAKIRSLEESYELGERLVDLLTAQSVDRLEALLEELKEEED